MSRLSYSAVNTFKECPSKYYKQKVVRAPLNSSALPFGKAVESGVDVVLKGGTLEEAIECFVTEWEVQPASKWGPPKEIFDSPDIFYYASDYDKSLFTPQDVDDIEVWYKELLTPEEQASLVTYKNSKISDKKKHIKTLNPVESSEVIKDIISDNALLTDSQRKFYHRVMWTCCVIRGTYLIQAFQEQLLPQVEEVISLQKEISMKNAEGDSVTGFVDYIFKLKGIEGPVIIDLKTAGKLYESHNLDTSDQLKIYAAAEDIPNIGYMVLFKKIGFDTVANCDKCDHLRTNPRKKNCEKCDKGKYTKVVKTPKMITQLLTKKLDSKEVTKVMDDVHNIMTAIENKIEWKNPNSCNNFNTKCEYYDVCWGTKSMDELKKELKK